MADVVGGIDLSRYQTGPNDFAAVRESGRRFAVQRWSVGPHLDSTRIRHLRGIIDAGLLPGAYHVLSQHHDPILQARQFVDEVKEVFGDSLGGGFLWVLDAESSGTVGNPSWLQCLDFLVELASLTLQRPVAYIPKWWMVAQGWGADQVGAIVGTGALWWQSRYPFTVNFSRPPETFHGWRASFWQFSSTAAVPGIPGRCDDNVFYGTAAQLAAVAGADPTPNLDEEEDDDMLWLIKGADRPEWWLTDWITKRHIATQEDADVVIWCQAAAGRPVQTAAGNQPHELGQQAVIDRIPVVD